MDEEWIQIAGEDVDVEAIMRQIRERIARRQGLAAPGEAGRQEIAGDLWREMIGEAAAPEAAETVWGRLAAIRPRDCDIVPRYYTIDWRVPILGPLHALVRKVINAEIRRYLSSTLEKQSHWNRQVLQVLKGLARENALLRQELARSAESRIRRERQLQRGQQSQGKQQSRGEQE